ncbi:MAG TPA: hypothetical protein VN794_18905 [Methylomirabilota bacterium]|jgi:hypothetical protein|nr:hypothetical protein [Methylomirabilota bacterium]
MKATLAQSSFGRVVLHLLCLCRDGKFRWHWAGMSREFQRSPVSH